ncbi:MAG TPA: hypothetical protein VK639_07640, partial [Terriglobales bacterium]|nr:hypothetical protein [Terriglobales bacterium]
ISAPGDNKDEKKYSAKTYQTNCHIAKSACRDSQRRGYVTEATSLYVFDRQTWRYRIRGEQLLTREEHELSGRSSEQPRQI